MFKTLSVALVAASLITGAATAATLSGDQVTITLDPVNVSFSGTVGAGTDVTLGAFQADFNAGANGNGFTFFDNGGFFSRSNTMILSSLDFTDGSTLTGFTLTGGSLSNLSVSSVTADSVTFTFDTTGFGPNAGATIEGFFVTSSDVAPVPLPAAGLLLVAGLGGIAALRRFA